MKKTMFLLVAAVLFCMSPIASAAPRHHNGHNWSHPAYHGSKWEHADRGASSLPFNWYERRYDRVIAHERLERIHDYEWEHRFPGLRSYRWHAHPGQAFWYHGRRIDNAILFYDSHDELVSVGFMHDGAFIFIRDDGEYRNHDSFFLSWRW